MLSGSAARDMATERSDVDVYVVRNDDGQRETSHSPAIDEIYWSVADLEQVDRHGTGGWYFRWSFAYAQVLRDLTDGRITEAVRRQATVDDDEQHWVLIDQDRLDGYLNFAYRALKNQRDGRLLEARLDAGESVPWLLHVMFTLAGRLRPYNKYLPWELRTHPLSVPEWSAEAFLPEIERTLAGDPDAHASHLRDRRARGSRLGRRPRHHRLWGRRGLLGRRTRSLHRRVAAARLPRREPGAPINDGRILNGSPRSFPNREGVPRTSVPACGA